MKVNGVGGPSASPPSRPASRSGDGFRLPAAGGSAPSSSASATTATAGLTGISSLMALQGVEDATERKRRAMRRGSTLLDKLDELKLALLGGDNASVSLNGLSQAAAMARDSVDDPGLSSVLDQIDLRAAVELAKAEAAAKRR